jgi:hypothetical protein
MDKAEAVERLEDLKNYLFNNKIQEAEKNPEKKDIRALDIVLTDYKAVKDKVLDLQSELEVLKVSHKVIEEAYERGQNKINEIREKLKADYEENEKILKEVDLNNPDSKGLYGNALTRKLYIELLLSRFDMSKEID